MNSVEDQVRAATRAQADLLREVRPLQLPTEAGAGHELSPAARARRARRVKIWIAPLAAAAAVVALVTATLLIRNIPNAPVVPATRTATPPGSDDVPEYYMALPGGDNFLNSPGATKAVLGNTFTGQQLLSVRPSGTDKFVSVMAATDDRTFVLGGEANPPLGDVPAARDWYVVHVSLTPVPRATIRKLAITLPASVSAMATALSPDGSELAVSSEMPTGLVGLRVYSVTTGALLNSWSGMVPGDAAYVAADSLTWTADGQRMAFAYTYRVAHQTYYGVGLLTVDRPGHDLFGNSRRVWSEDLPDNISGQHPLSCGWAEVSPLVVVSPDAGTLICGAYTSFAGPAIPTPGQTPRACLKGVPPVTVAFLEYSTASGRLLRPLYSDRSNCTGAPLNILWTSPSGNKIIGSIADLPVKSANHRTIPRPAFGLFSGGKFTRLPQPPTITVTAIAW